MKDMCFFSSCRASHGTDDMPYIVGVIDVVNAATGRGHYSGESLDQVRLRYPTAEIVTFEEANRRNEDAVIKAPWEISEERYTYLLNVMPPCGWTRRGWAESFYVSERITGSVVTWAIRVDSRFFEMRDRVHWGHHAVVNSCETLIQSQAMLAAASAV